MDFSFMGGSMGSVVGEKVSRAAERALEKKTPPHRGICIGWGTNAGGDLLPHADG